MDQQLQTAIRLIHASPIQAALVASGGGSQAFAWLMSVPGATRTVLEVTLPYSYASFDRFVGFHPEHYVTPEIAVAMSRVAYRRARILAPEGTPSIGVACTATLVTDRPKRGEHRCHVAVMDEAGITAYTLTLTKGKRDRAEEDDVVSRLIIAALADVCGVESAIELGLLPGEQVERTRTESPDPVLALLRGQTPAITIAISGQVSTARLRGAVLLPGAFNPLHGGHLQLAHVAGQMTGRPVHFELSIRNVDKPPLVEAEVRQRLEQFWGRGTIAVTAAPLFEEKAALFLDSIFVVGYDTATRLVNPRYYGDSTAAMLRSLASIREHGGRFLVAGRLYGDRFRTLVDVPVPEGFADLFAAIPSDLFRADISSTELREKFLNHILGE